MTVTALRRHRGYGPKRRTGGGRRVELRVVCRHCGDSGGRFSNPERSALRFLLFEEAHAFGDEYKAGPLVESGENECDFLQWQRCSAHQSKERQHETEDI